MFCNPDLASVKCEVLPTFQKVEQAYTGEEVRDKALNSEIWACDAPEDQTSQS